MAITVNPTEAELDAPTPPLIAEQYISLYASGPRADFQNSDGGPRKPQLLAESSYLFYNVRFSN